MISGHGVTHPGKVRHQNEDGMLVLPEIGLFAVADGMGGHNAGEVASALALESVQAFLARPFDPDETWPFGFDPTLTTGANRLRTAVKLANRRVFHESEARTECTGMGTTVAAILVEGDSVLVCSVGDSRVYRVGPDGIARVTRDHTWIETLLAQNPDVDPATLATHPLKHVLTSVIGVQDDLDVTAASLSLVTGDRFVLCTDGVHGPLTDDRIASIVRRAGSPAAAAQQLVDEALEVDGRDNLTAVVVEYIA